MNAEEVNIKKAYVYKMNVTIATIVSILVMVLLVLITYVCKIDFFNDGWNGIVVIILFFLYMMLHELLHGLGAFLGGTKIKNISYGIALEKGVFYAMTNQEVTKKNIILTLQMPFMLIGVVTYIIGAIFNIPLLVLLSIVNIGGASMDLMMLFYILRLPVDVTYCENSSDEVSFVLISSSDLTKKKSLFFNIVDVKEYKKEDYVFNNIRRFTITKGSIIIILVTIIVAICSNLIEKFLL